jgi:hypothetical protein
MCSGRRMRSDTSPGFLGLSSIQCSSLLHHHRMLQPRVIHLQIHLCHPSQMRMSSIWGETTSLHLHLLLQCIQQIYLHLRLHIPLHLQPLLHSMTTLSFLPHLHYLVPPANTLSLSPSRSAMRRQSRFLMIHLHHRHHQLRLHQHALTRTLTTRTLTMSRVLRSRI